jgi:four helix bundle protein
MSIQGLEKLEAWRKAKDFALKVHREVLPLLPPEEKWALNQQIRRSAQSIPANIAEGYGRYYYQDNVRFCYNARGSLEETLSHIVLAHELDYLPDALYQELGRNGEDLTRLINGYIAYLKRSKQGVNELGAHYAVREPFELYIEDTLGDEH